MTTGAVSTARTAKKRSGAAGSGDRIAAGLMLAAAIIAVVWANVVPHDGYAHFWETPIEFAIGSAQLEITLHEFVNDVLMTLFFFLVGLEVKREFTIGELTSRDRALVPVVAAVAGLLVPALVFVAMTASSGQAHAWGIVISTDTAFLLGALALLAPPFPKRLRTFLLTLAVVDDVGALLVIGLFYSSGLQPVPLLVAVVLMVLLALVRLLPAGRGLLYAVLGAALWAAVMMGGIHPTLAGVAVALLIPVFPPRRSDVERTAQLTQAFRESPNTAYAAAVTRSVRDSLSINERLDAAWRPYVAFGILPIFALANAGVHLDAETLRDAATSPLTWAVIVGLVAGKFAGITAATALVQRMGWGRLAPGLTLTRVAGGAALSGIGFTISLFIIPLALDDPHAQDLARVGVLTGSLLAFLLGWAVLSIGDRVRPPHAVGARLNRPVDPDRDHIKGRADAPYTIVEYADYECPFCSRATGSVSAVRAHFGDEIRWVYRHLPLDAVHPHATAAARAAEAAAAQGRFFEYTAQLFDNQARLEPEDLVAYADRVGLDVDRFARDMRSAEAARRVDDDRDDADLMDIHSTPTFFIGDRRHVGPYDSASLIRALEDAAVRGADSPPTAPG
ncbi:Na+/H+ antiporter NhaA [Microbacterium hominis]|uniref:Na(+)/H(+) antiporter NhaA n=1 Tax=Microbacterium hominis TaxID=162426 RepID=A0A7D4PLN3_9MICO|nr:Na+/H+ antiporter NhaA [Microbacterium hominis]QKJ18975.1 Na+/H+ antiporter NhaA [Microbacterium hominis]